MVECYGLLVSNGAIKRLQTSRQMFMTQSLTPDTCCRAARGAGS